MYYQQGYRPPSQQNKPGRKKGMGKGVKALIASLVSVVVVAGIIVGVIAGRNAMEANRERQALAAEVEAVQNVYLPNIYVDGIAIGGMSAQQGIDAVVQHATARQEGWNLQLKELGE